MAQVRFGKLKCAKSFIGNSLGFIKNRETVITISAFFHSHSDWLLCHINFVWNFYLSAPTHYRILITLIVDETHISLHKSKSGVKFDVLFKLVRSQDFFLFHWFPTRRIQLSRALAAWTADLLITTTIRCHSTRHTDGIPINGLRPLTFPWNVHWRKNVRSIQAGQKAAGKHGTDTFWAYWH